MLDELCYCHAYRSGYPDIPRATIKTLLVALSTYTLTALELDERFQRLAQMELVPVRMSLENAKFSAFVDQEWFIPDRSRYAKCFEGKLWLLDFEKKQIDSLKHFFERMGLTKHELSRCVTEETITEGDHATHPRITEALRAKARYISL